MVIISGKCIPSFLYRDCRGMHSFVTNWSNLFRKKRMEFYIIACFVALLYPSLSVTTADAAPPAHFVFGDSLLDNGNNNYIATTAKANIPPYGIDYPGRVPNGRFSNGLNMADFISQKLGAEPVLPYLDPSLNGSVLLRGANFASAGVGILNDTGLQFGQIIRMPQQFQYFQQYQDRVSRIIGRDATNRLVAEGLVSIALGGNDYVNNYFLFPVTIRSVEYTIPTYTSFIISEFEKYLARFYELGARRVLVLSTGSLGCNPMERATRSRNGECAAQLQQAAAIFNSQLISAVIRLNKRFSAQIFTVSKMFPTQRDLYNNPQEFGFADGKNACCGQGPYNGLGRCTVVSNLCPDRGNNLWWDPFHPTERACRIIVDEIFSGSNCSVSPVSLRDLMKLDV